MSARFEFPVEFVAHAKYDLTQTNTWYKDVVNAKSFSTLFSAKNEPTSRACRDTAMKTGCIRDNYIGDDSPGSHY